MDDTEDDSKYPQQEVEQQMNVAAALEEHRSGRDEDGQDQQKAVDGGAHGVGRWK